MARRKPFVSDELWEKVSPLLPPEKPGKLGGRPRRNNREVLEGILWVLKTGAPWIDLPQGYPSPATCWRRLVNWEKKGIWLNIWQVFLGALDDKHRLEWKEFFVDGSFSPAKKGGFASARPRKAKEPNGWLRRMEREYQSLSTLSRRLEQKSSCSKKRSTKSESRKKAQEDHDASRRE